MKNYKQFINKSESGKIFEAHEVEDWSPTEILEGERIYTEMMGIYEADGIKGLNAIDEGFLSKLIGGAAGFIIGPSVGKVIAKALGVEKGILYDMFTSRLVGAALGAALTKSLK